MTTIQRHYHLSPDIFEILTVSFDSDQDIELKKYVNLQGDDLLATPGACQNRLGNSS